MKKLLKSFKSNTRVYDDNTIEVTPQAEGTPSQKDVKKVGRSKRYATTGKNPLTCVELKCPEEVTDKAAYFREELAKLTKDIEISRPAMPKGMYLLSEDNLKVSYDKKEGTVSVWLTLKAEGFTEKRGELYCLTSEIDKCLAFNRALLSRQSQ